MVLISSSADVTITFVSTMDKDGLSVATISAWFIEKKAPSNGANAESLGACQKKMIRHVLEWAKF